MLTLPAFMQEEFMQELEQRPDGDEAKLFCSSLAKNGFAIIDLGIKDFDGIAERVIRETTPIYAGKTRIQDAWRKVPVVREIATLEKVRNLLTFAYGRRPIPFQTLNFRVGTEQRSHSDTIHFDCFPKHFMCGVWGAYEDADLENGALHYIPGTHRLPILSLEDFGLPRSTFINRNQIYQKYEEALGRYVARMSLQRQIVPVRKGQALVWAANLLHGGSNIIDRKRTRHSQVTHYYFENCLYLQPLWSDFHSGKISYKKVFDIERMQYVKPTYNGKPFRLPLMAHFREYYASALRGVRAG